MIFNLVNDFDSYTKVELDTDSIDKFRTKIESLIPDYLKKEQEIAVRTTEQSKVMMLG